MTSLHLYHLPIQNITISIQDTTSTVPYTQCVDQLPCTVYVSSFTQRKTSKDISWQNREVHPAKVNCLKSAFMLKHM